MFKKKLLLSAAATVLSVVALSACGGTQRSSDKLYICVYDGGYGTEWIKKIAEDYMNRLQSASGN